MSDKKIAELSDLVGQLSDSLLATRKRQSQLAELLDASFRNLHLNLAGLESRFEKALDDRLTRFKQTKGEDARASDETLAALNRRLEAETARNENALSDVHASLAKIEQNLAGSETRLDEALESRLNHIEQARSEDAKANDETLKTLSGRLEAETARNENALSNFGASIAKIEQHLAGSETRLDEALEARLKQFEQTNGDDARTINETLNALSRRLEDEATRNENALSDFRASLTKIEQNLASSETRLEESLGGRLEHIEQARSEDAKASDEALKTLNRRLEAETARNENALSNFGASIAKIEQHLAGSETRLNEALESRLNHIEQVRSEDAKANDETLKTLSGRLEAETARNENALSDFRASLEKIEQNLASSEARLEETLDGRLTRIEQTKGEDGKAGDETLMALNRRLEAETAHNEKALSDIRASLAKIEQNLASSETRFEEALDERLRRFEHAKGEKIESKRKVVEELMGEGNIREAMEMHWNKRGA